MNICVVTDDNSGFTKDEIASFNNLYVLRMPILIDGECFFENQTIDAATFYKKLEICDVKTSQPSPGEVVLLWEKLLNKYDQVIHIPMSSGLSASCDSAKSLSMDFKGKVFVVDNHRISVTLKSSVYDALHLIKEGLDGEKIKNLLEEEGFNSSIYIMVDTLKYLKKGGRITPAAALVGDALHLKPVLSIFGLKLDAYAKCLGTKKAKQCMFDAIDKDLLNKFKNFSKEDLVFGIAYTSDLNTVLEFKKEVMEHYNLLDVEVNPLSLSVATHIGPGALALTLSYRIK